MANYPIFRFANRDIRRVGDALRQEILWENPEDRGRAREIFAVANSWRDSHAYPMRRIRSELGGQLQKTGLRTSGITAARLKRMPSIRRKLRIHSAGLNQIQDLAGCRVIVPSIQDVREIIAFNLENSKHEIYKPYDYIANPKTDGYRCYHRVFKFIPSNDSEESFAGRRVEVQFRTRNQHSWATAVEAVGLFRGEDLKGGSGHPSWRRLFELMSSELALAEESPEVPGSPPRKDRMAELKELDKQLDAVAVLENLSQAFNYTELYRYDDDVRYFLIEYDKGSLTVNVKPYSTPMGGTESLDNIEAEIESGRSKSNAVLVEADKIEALKEAYPNYFGDVQVFKTNLKSITQGKAAREYVLPPQQTVPPPPRPVADTAWFRRPRFRGPRS